MLKQKGFKLKLVLKVINEFFYEHFGVLLRS